MDNKDILLQGVLQLEGYKLDQICTTIGIPKLTPGQKERYYVKTGIVDECMEILNATEAHKAPNPSPEHPKPPPPPSPPPIRTIREDLF